VWPAAANTSVRPSSNSLADGGESSRLSTSTFSGWRGVTTSRTVSLGSSSRTVPAPVRTAQARARQWWPSARAADPVIHWLRPLARAVLPSMLAATFRRTHGRPLVMRDTKPMLSSRASRSKSPVSTVTPAAASFLKPSPATRGFGSCIAATTRATPAPMRASAQGGVRPKWLQGSSVTYAVAPRAASPATASALASACGRPAASCQPSPTTRPSRASTQPTRGFGVVV
jgi:hypothetical protein